MPVISYPFSFFFGHYNDNIMLWQKSVKMGKRVKLFEKNYRETIFW